MTRWTWVVTIAGALLAAVPEVSAQGFDSPFTAGGAKATSKQQNDAVAPQPGKNIEAKTVAPPASNSLARGGLSARSPDAYRIGPQDVLEISVFGVPELSGSLIVADNGTIQLPLLGETPAAGKTPRELQNNLAAGLGAEYLQNPQVTVTVKEYNSSTVVLMGEILKPGVYPLKGKMTLLELVASAGGFKESSDSTVLILRDSGGKRMGARFDVSDIEKGRAADPTMQSGDTVVAGSSMIRKTYQGFLKALPIAGMFAMF